MTPAFTPNGLATKHPTYWTAEERAEWVKLYRRRGDRVLPFPFHARASMCEFCNVFHDLVSEAGEGK